jgi:hypothetical protein
MLSLSWSRLSDYEQCPRKFQLKYIEKQKNFAFDEKSPHLIKGQELHKQLELYIKAMNGEAEPQPGYSPEVRQTLPFVDKLFQNFSAVYPEAQVSCKFSTNPDLRWKPCEWFDQQSLYRAIWDYPLQPGVFGQLHLSSVIALHRFQEAEEVEAAFLYLMGRQVDRVHVHRGPSYVKEVKTPDGKVKPVTVESLEEVQADFERRFEIVQLEKVWKPKPNEFCKWCEATKAQCPMSKKQDFGGVPTSLPGVG